MLLTHAPGPMRCRANRHRLIAIAALLAVLWLAGQAMAASATRAGAPPPIDVNTASAAELERIRGIGPALAARIVGVRSAGGRFRDTDELRHRVRGIGEANLRRMAAAGLVVGGAARVEPVRAAARARVDLLVGNAPAKSEPRSLGRIEELGCCGVRGALSAESPPDARPPDPPPAEVALATTPKARKKR